MSGTGRPRKKGYKVEHIVNNKGGKASLKDNMEEAIIKLQQQKIAPSGNIKPE
jgi:hypothetical protein